MASHDLSFCSYGSSNCPPGGAGTALGLAAHALSWVEDTRGHGGVTEDVLYSIIHSSKPVVSKVHSHMLDNSCQGKESFSHNSVNIAGGEFGFKILHGDISRVQGPVRLIKQEGVEWLIQFHSIIRQSGLPNHTLARIYVQSPLKIQNWEYYLSNYPDRLIVDYLQFGFPLSVCRQGFKHINGFYNHSSAENYATQVQKYFDQEFLWWRGGGGYFWSL